MITQSGSLEHYKENAQIFHCSIYADTYVLVSAVLFYVWENVIQYMYRLLAVCVWWRAYFQLTRANKNLNINSRKQGKYMYLGTNLNINFKGVGFIFVYNRKYMCLGTKINITSK